ncbi:MAG: AAA family ATPase [Bacteroidota bacterium]
MKNINVIGTSGSGKSTFARKLAEELGYPYIELDALFWGPNWTEPSDEVLFDKLENALEQDYWVLDGNYSRTNHIKWPRTDTIIWIDFSFWRTLWQAVSRAISRVIDQKELWPGTNNRESLRMLFSHDSIVLWTLRTYCKNVRRYSQLPDNPQYAHIQFHRLRSPEECEKWLTEIEERKNMLNED